MEGKSFFPSPAGAFVLSPTLFSFDSIIIQPHMSSFVIYSCFILKIRRVDIFGQK